MTTLTAAQIQHEGLADWVLVVRALEARYETNGFATGLELVARIGAAAEEADHHPDVTLTWPTVLVRLWSHDSRGVTERDIALARRISAIAQELGVAATPARTQNLELCLDTADIKAAGPFWAAVLGYDWDEENLEIVDPDGRMPTTWFQQTDEHGSTGTPPALAPRHPRRPGRRRPAHRRGAGRGRRPGERRGSTVVHDPGRPGGQPGLRLHLAVRCGRDRLTPTSGTTIPHVGTRVRVG